MYLQIGFSLELRLCQPQSLSDVSSEDPGRPGDRLEVFQLILHLIEGRLQDQAGHEVLGVPLEVHQCLGGDGCTKGVAPHHQARSVLKSDHLLQPPEDRSPVLHCRPLRQGDRAGVTVRPGMMTLL